MDMGGYVIIINAEKVTVTGNKFNDKLYRSHPTSKPGTLKVETFRQVNEVCITLLELPSHLPLLFDLASVNAILWSESTDIGRCNTMV